MEQLELLAVALGLAGLSGINLYLTVFVTGLAINQRWIELLPQYETLAVLGHPAIVAAAGALYFLEFFADKVPWVDSLWDSVHTVIRPIGAAMMSIQVLGDTTAVFQVMVGLLGGGTALLTHGVKSSTRLVANASPEPVSNVALSVLEDIGVVGGLLLVSFNPFLAFGVLVVCLGLIIYFLPRLYRMAKVQLWLIYRKLCAPATDGEQEEPLPAQLPPDLDILFAHHTVLEEKPLWAVPCVSAGGKRIPPNVFGCLIATAEEPGKLHFIGKTRFSTVARTLDLEGYKAVREPKLLSENLVLYRTEKKAPKFRFIFERGERARVAKMVSLLERRLKEPDESDAESDGQRRTESLTG